MHVMYRKATSSGSMFVLDMYMVGIQREQAVKVAEFVGISEHCKDNVRICPVHWDR